MSEAFAPRRRRFDERKVKRNKGRFAKKVGRALLDPTIPERRLIQTPRAQVFARHGDGDVTHVSEDGNSRLVYDANARRYDVQTKDDDGNWQSGASLSRLQAYRQVGSGWRVANDQDQGAGVRAVPADAQEPAAAPGAPDPNALPPMDPMTPPPAAFPARTPADMATMLPGADTRTQAQRDAIRNYSVTGYRDMNNCLRTGQSCDPDVTARNAEMESAMSVSTDPMTVHRAMNLRNLAGGTSADQLASLVGQEISDSGFTSTSLDRSQTEVFGSDPDSVNLEIEMPTGTRALFSGADAAIADEQEVILPPGTRYRVVEATPGNPPDRPTLRIQVIP